MKIVAGAAAAFVLAVTSLPVAGDDRPACLLSTGDITARPALDGPVMLDFPGGPASIELACEGRQIKHLLVRLPVGSRHDITLYAGAGSDRGAWRATDADGAALDWIELDASRRHADSTIVRIRSPRGAAAGESLSARILINPNRPGDERSSIPVDVELTEEAPMFRDQFDVDPVIGQFSLVL